MKKFLFLLMLGLVSQAVTLYAQGYNIKITVPSMSNKNVILANYFEGKVYAVDTAKLNASGTGAFTLFKYIIY